MRKCKGLKRELTHLEEVLNGISDAWQILDNVIETQTTPESVWKELKGAQARLEDAESELWAHGI